MKRYYYLSNVGHDRFALETQCFLCSYSEPGDLSEYPVVTIFFDVRARLSSEHDHHNTNRRVIGKDAYAATIAAWSIREDRFSNDNEQKESNTDLTEELGRATLERDQDYKFVYDLIRRANDLKKSIVLAALRRPDRFLTFASVFQLPVSMN